jgi:hypothetical protein
MRNVPGGPQLGWDEGEFYLEEDWSTTVNGSVLTVPEGFTFDLSSIPRFLRPFVDRTELGVRAPLVHDFIYRTRGFMATAAVIPHRRFNRFDADRYFLKLMKADGIGRVKRWAAWLGVRVGGWLPWPPSKSHVLDVVGRSFHTLWQVSAAVWLANGWLIPVVAAGLAAVKSTVWPWLRDTVRSVTY